jgi:membrane protease YdiL (CAAX protease family)
VPGKATPPSVARFYLLALGISWAGWVPFAASQVGLLSFAVPWEIPLLAQFGPSVAAFVLTARHEGTGGVRRLFARALRWRVPARWYLVALLTTPAIAGLWMLGHALLGDPTPGWEAVRQWPARYAETFGGGGVYAIDSTPHASFGPIAFLRRLVHASPWLALANFIAFSVLTGPVSEEFGWRGWAQPRLQNRRSALKASLTVGVLWGMWHTGPDFWRILLQGDPRAFLYPMAMTIGTVPLSVIFTWLYNSTGSSLLPPMLFHASFNATLSVLGLLWTSRSPLLIGAELVLGLWVLAALLVLRYGGERLSSRRLQGVRP